MPCERAISEGRKHLLVAVLSWIQNVPVSIVAIFRWQNRSSWRWSALPKGTQLVCCRTRVWTRTLFAVFSLTGSCNWGVEGVGSGTARSGMAGMTIWTLALSPYLLFPFLWADFCFSLPPKVAKIPIVPLRLYFWVAGRWAWSHQDHINWSRRVTPTQTSGWLSTAGCCSQSETHAGKRVIFSLCVGIAQCWPVGVTEDSLSGPQ